MAMHKEFLKLLEKATGRSEYVIAINLDIRGFTPFCKEVDSVDVATYIKKIYLKIINNYFKNALYYKPTGDGLILIIPYTEEKLKEVANSTINSCLSLLEDFSSLCIGEAMITYPTPQKIGIGLSRGSACCITAEDKVRDYSGRILNLASRLMDLARPSGIVFDDSFGIDLLPNETKELFSEETVYVRGIAEEEPIKVFHTKKHTLIPDSYKQPLKEPTWITNTQEHLLKTLKTIRERFTTKLDRKPLDENKIRVEIAHDKPGIEGFETVMIYSIDDDEVEFLQRGNRYYVTVMIHDIIKELEKEGVTEDMKIRIDIIYPVK
jgi:hypothetical protein